MSEDVDAQCSCGHRDPEHSIFGPCRGCLLCDDDGTPVDHVHDYRRCGCSKFEPFTELDFDALLLEPLT